jgi:hypothetical protein
MFGRSMLLVAVAALATQSACTRACTNVGCIGLTLTLQPSAGTLPVGAYRVELELDGVTEVCSFTVANGAALAGVDCATEAPEFTLPDAHVQILLDDADQISYRITHDGTELVPVTTVTPAYTVLEPNGPGCGSCRSANIDVAL